MQVTMKVKLKMYLPFRDCADFFKPGIKIFFADLLLLTSAEGLFMLEPPDKAIEPVDANTR
jgi:hypothetical protein